MSVVSRSFGELSTSMCTAACSACSRCRSRRLEQTAVALLDAAERIVLAAGLEGLSLRGLADEVGTTRAVYSLFGSKDGLLVALGTRAFELLGAAIRELETTDDPAADPVEAGVAVFRRFAIEHPPLFRIGVQHTLPAPALARKFSAAAAEAFAGLEARMTRLEDAGLLGPRTVRDAACEFHALCEGLAAVELRALMPARQEARIWRDALTAFVAGFAASGTGNSRSPKTRNVAGVPR
jgi:AcrR family transcriptional regulator